MTKGKPFSFLELLLWDKSPKGFADEYTRCLEFIEGYEYYPKQQFGLVLIHRQGTIYPDDLANAPKPGTMVVVEDVDPKEFVDKFNSYSGLAADFSYYPSHADDGKGFGFITFEEYDDKPEKTPEERAAARERLTKAMVGRGARTRWG